MSLTQRTPTWLTYLSYQTTREYLFSWVFYKRRRAVVNQLQITIWLTWHFQPLRIACSDWFMAVSRISILFFSYSFFSIVLYFVAVWQLTKQALNHSKQRNSRVWYLQYKCVSRTPKNNAYIKLGWMALIIQCSTGKTMSMKLVKTGY